jgi:hypothetical protein
MMRPATRTVLSALAVWAFATASGARPSASHCRPGESVIFTCALGAKVASVCSSGGKIIYRYGRLGALEMEIASDGKDGKAFHSSGVGGGGGSFDNVRFTNNGSNYVVSSAVAGNLTEIPGKAWSTFTVMQGQKSLWTQECARVSPQDRLQNLGLPEDPDDNFAAWY